MDIDEQLEQAADAAYQQTLNKMFESNQRDEMRKRRELIEYMDANQLRIRLNFFLEFSICILLLSLAARILFV